MAQFLIRRSITAMAMIFAISIVSFILIQLPPGDFLSTYIADLREMGERVPEEQIEAARERYGLEDPIYIQYAKWMRAIILHGDFGQSMQLSVPVEHLIKREIGYTVLVGLASILFVWVVAIPIGVFSATHQYSLLDYVFTFIGFLGLATPGFLIGLVVMWIGFSEFGVTIGGLYSPKYSNAPWSIAKIVDLVKHLWIPVIIVGITWSAGLIRTMRANMLDELSQPYVETARAKGLSEWRVIWKYPVRVALNPFISTIGYALPQIVGGIVITAVVLNLPILGPLLLNALLSQDMFLAGAIVLLLGTLTVLGTLVSDILLVVFDPRIRLE